MFFALRMARGSRKRKSSLLSNLTHVRSNDTTNVSSITTKRARTKSSAQPSQKLINNDQTKAVKEVKKLPFRHAVHTGLYFEIPKPRGRNGGYKRSLRSVRNLKNSRQVNKLLNEKAKLQSREQTKQRQAARKAIDEEAYRTLLVVFNFVTVTFVFVIDFTSFTH